MKATLHMYVAQPKKGHYEASIPWVAHLAEPVRGPSPAQLKEELMFRVLELVHGGVTPMELDRIIPPQRPYLSSLYLNISRKVDPDRPPVEMVATTHVIVGQWPEEEITRLWLPKVPGTCLAIEKVDDMYAMMNLWAREWAETNMVENLDLLATQYVAQIESMEIDLGFPVVIPGAGSGPPGGRLRRPETLQEVATNLSHRADDGTLGRAFGRERLVEEVVEALMSPRPQNICLIGPPGVGKTAIVHEAASRAFNLAQAYQERRDIWQTSGDRIIAGMSIIGQWEQRTETLCRELAERGDVLFAEDLLALVRAGRTYHGDSNVARFVEPYLEQDQFGIIAEATEETWVLARAMAPGFVDKFRRIQVPELSYRETLGVITDLIRDIEGGHRVRFTADGVESLLHLGRRFFRNEAFPGKAVRLVKRCQYEALRALNDEPGATEIRVDPDRVAHVVHRQTGLPRTILRPGTGRTSDEIRRTYESRIFGQPRAVDVVSRLVLTIEQGLSDPGRPLAALLLVGPSGVGKTETAKALAADLFGSDERMVRFDMSELSESTAVTRLIGTPYQPEGELTSKVRLQPFCVLLFDEIEKAHPAVLDLLLQVLGDGRLTDAAGRTVDFRNAIVVMTSNLGAHSEDRWLGFSDQSRADREIHYRRAAEEFFRPELFNRIDHVVPYGPLGPEALRRIARRTLQNLLERRGLRQAQVMVDVDEGLIDYLAQRSVDPRYGARTLAHRIERTLVNPLAHRLTTWEARDSLTRVTMKPSEEGVAMDLETIDRAPTVHLPKRELKAAASVIEELAYVSRRVAEVAEDPRREEVTRDYEQLLGRINELGGWNVSKDAAQNPETRRLADELRRREGFLSRLQRLERRVAGLQDPRGTGEFLYAGDPKDRKGAHRWGGIAAEIRADLTWLECQLQALTEEGALGGTLVLTGLSGPYDPLLADWRRWLDALDEALELEAVWAERTKSGWAARGTSDGPITALALSSVAPGTRHLFEVLLGYTWSPLPPSHGQHALVVARSAGEGLSDPKMLVDHLGTWIDDDSRPAIEFIVANGQLEDVRYSRSYPIPEDRSANLRQFVSKLAIGRLTAVMFNEEPFE